MTTIFSNQTVPEEFQYQEMEVPTRVHSAIIAIAAVASFIVALSLCFAIFHFRAFLVEKWFMTKKETRRDDGNRDPEMLREDTVVVHDVQFPNEAFQLEGATGITDKPEPSPSIFQDDVFLQEVLTSVADICSPGKSISIQNNNLSQNIQAHSESGELNLLNEYYCVNGVIEDVLDGLVQHDQHVINSPTSIDQTGHYPSLLRRNPSYLEAVRRCREADESEAIAASTIDYSSSPSGSKWQSTPTLDGSSKHEYTPSTALKVSRSIITSMIHNSSSLSRAINNNIGSENVLLTVNAEGSHYVTCNSVAISENVSSPEHSLDYRNSTYGSSGSKWQSTPVQDVRTSIDREPQLNINNEDGATILATPSSASKVAQSIINSMIHKSSSLSQALDEDGGPRSCNRTQTPQPSSCEADATCVTAVLYENEQPVGHGDTVLASSGSKWQSTPILDGRRYDGDDAITGTLAMPSSGLHLEVSGSYSPVYSPSLQHRSIHNSFSRSNYSQRSFVGEKGENVCGDITTPAPAKSLSLENSASSMSGELYDQEENFCVKGLLEDMLEDVVLHV